MKLTRKAEATRQHILDTGRDLVLRKGFSGVGLQEILSSCGVPKGSFYHYFPSKEAFGCALLEQYVESYRARLEELLSGEASNGRQRLMRYWHACIDDPVLSIQGETCMVVKLAAEIADLSDEMRRVLDAGVERLLDRIATVIVEGREDGSLSISESPHHVARVLYQMWLGAALLAKLGRRDGPLRQALAATEYILTCSESAAAGLEPDQAEEKIEA
jgi:TetR/AcrR family transcriptional regulator, transcriptional repressor for nem operon